MVVAGDRDCTLQRRHQKLVEEAPAPFVSVAQRHVLHRSALAICAEAGYQGVGTVEFLLATDGSISFLEVNTRLQVEHPVTEETSGVDLVAAQLRIAAGDALSPHELSLTPRGHAFEFRINAEDPARAFLPAPGTLTAWRAPSGPGIRTDSGVETGSAVGAQWDSLLAKLIVTGSDRAEALARARRALGELVVEGMATVVPFHRAVVADPAFASAGAGRFGVHTRWVETEWTDQERAAGRVARPGSVTPQAGVATIEIGGRVLEVALPGVADAAALSRRTTARSGDAVDAPCSLVAPMQGTVVRIEVAEGDRVATGDLVAMIEAMKIEHPVQAPAAGVVRGLAVTAGTVLGPGTVICEVAVDR